MGTKRCPGRELRPREDHTCTGADGKSCATRLEKDESACPACHLKRTMVWRCRDFIRVVKGGQVEVDDTDTCGRIMPRTMANCSNPICLGIIMEGKLLKVLEYEDGAGAATTTTKTDAGAGAGAG